MQEKMHMRWHPGTNPLPFDTKIAGFHDSALLLDETHCYPRGGGQPGDMGTITSNEGNITSFFEVLPGEMHIHPVNDVREFTIGQDVTCEIDAERRNLHSMMHTSQHIVSALAEDMWGTETVGNQIGAEESRVDLLFEDRSVFEPDNLFNEVNSILESSIAVNVHEWDRDRILGHEQMRHTKFMHRIPSSITHLRVVEVEGVDLCPCAGTHVSNTSHIPRVEYQGKKNKGKGRYRISYNFE